MASPSGILSRNLLRLQTQHMFSHYPISKPNHYRDLARRNFSTSTSRLAAPAKDATLPPPQEAESTGDKQDPAVSKPKLEAPTAKKAPKIRVKRSEPLDVYGFEEVSKPEFDKHNKEMSKQLWEPYTTDAFNPEALDKAASVSKSDEAETSEDVAAQNQDPRPSRMYFMAPDDIEKHLPEGIAGDVVKYEFKRMEEKAVLSRPVVEDAIEWMEDLRDRHFMNRTKPSDYYMVLDGPTGVGKSVLLNPIVHHARLEGWLVCYIPDYLPWVSGNLTQSPRDPKMFDQLDITKKWLASLAKAHADKLETLPIRTQFAIGDQHSEFKGKTLLDLIKYGISSELYAGDALYHFRQELNGVHEYPVAIIVDGINAMNGPSSQWTDPLDPYIFSKPMPGERLTLSRAFGQLENHGLLNGLVLATTTRRAPCKHMTENKNFKLVKVPPYSLAECHLLVDYYRDNDHFVTSVPRQTVEYLWAMSSGIGRVFWQETKPL